MVCGCPSRSVRERLWDEIRDLAQMERLPWLCIGDFNQVIEH